MPELGSSSAFRIAQFCKPCLVKNICKINRGKHFFEVFFKHLLNAFHQAPVLIFALARFYNSVKLFYYALVSVATSLSFLS